MKTNGINLQNRIISGIITILAGFIFLLPSVASAQKVTPDTTRFLIGSQINVTLELETGQGSVVEWPVLGDTLTRAIEIISKSKSDTVKVEGSDKMVIKQVITITSFDTGFIVIPPIAFRVKTKTGAIQELVSEPVMLEVISVRVDAVKDIRDIKPILQAPYTLRDFLPWLLLAAAIGLLATLIWFYIRNRKKNKPLIRIPARQQKPPHVLALGMLDDLRKEQVWQKGQIKEYYTRLTDILRDYFEKRFGVNAAEMTSEEIISALKDHTGEVSVLSDLKKLLTLSDLAKFAKVKPIGAENELSMTYAKTIVLNTAAAPVSEDAGIITNTETQENRNPINE
ncbi:MAG: hypothetical protein IPN08_02840 [Bacteroidales bacterium]|nr:hypothetical protein [Bacteroidales bacterium]MBK9356317.1 hypothetical protein [Bacteroidales bacterium]